jgi:hypothetical protein
MAATITDAAVEKSHERFPNLETVVARRMWPTPTASDPQLDRRADSASDPYMTSTGSIRERRPDGTSSNLGLAAAVRMWPTLNAGDYKAGFSDAPNRQQSSLPRSVAREEGILSGGRGTLNPTWVAWLMGFPGTWWRLPSTDSETP